MSIFVDWLTVHQEHPEGVPKVCSGSTVKLSPDREYLGESVSKASVRGEFESHLQVVSDGRNVMVDFNPARIHRPDNLIGVSVSEAKAIASAVAESFGLPPFSGGPLVTTKSGTSYLTGARVTRLDTCRNLRLGSREAAKVFLVNEANQCRFRMKRDVFPGESITYRGSDRQIRIYDKADELEHKRRLRSGRFISPELQEWCRNEGVVRIEAENRRNLRALGLRAWDSLNDESLSRAFPKEFDCPEVFNVRSTAVLKDHPREAVKALALWEAGFVPRDFMSRNTFSKWRNYWRSYGVDITLPRAKIEYYQPVFTKEVVPEFVDESDYPEWIQRPADAAEVRRKALKVVK